MEWANGFHQGLRKDMVSPEFSHQVAIASHVRTFAQILRYPEPTIVAAFCHDLREDYNVPDHEIRTRFGDLVADAVEALTKEFDQIRRDDSAVYAAIATNPIASVVKAADRIHNHSSMLGVFSPQKMLSYTDETRKFVLPMLKAARRAHPDQEPVYETLSLVLLSQLPLLEALALVE